MTEKEKKLSELLNRRNAKYIRKLLVKQRHEYSCTEMIESSKELDDDKKIKVYLAILDILQDVGRVCEILKTDEEKALLIECMPKFPKGICCILFQMDKESIKRLVAKDKIKLVLEEIQCWDNIYDKFGDILEDEMIEIDARYRIMPYVNELSCSAFEKVCKRNLDIDGYNRLIEELKEPVKRRIYTNVFIKEKCCDAYVASKILDAKDYEEAEVNKLLMVVASFGKASIIYENLKINTLTESQRKMLEKALLETHNIEYISYYYFFNNKREFIKLYGSMLAFAAFASLHKELFKNTLILGVIMESIKDMTESTEYLEDISTRISNPSVKIKKRSKITDDLLVN